MKNTGWLLLSVLAVSPLARAQNQGPEVVYGEDDRLDLYQVRSPAVLRLARSTTALFPASSVSVEDGTARLATGSYAEDYSLCRSEPFYGQRNGAFCSGSLVGPDLVMTAGHCISSEARCQGTKFVFGFALQREGVLPESVPASDVYGCKELVGTFQQGQGADWALVRLDRRVSGREPLRVNRSGDPANGTRLFVIGHPAGLPTKVAGGAWVRDASPRGYFVANLDTYGGNSGSAVFNAATGLVEGILVRGEQDYVWKQEEGVSCRVSKTCGDTACRGEDVTKLSALSARIPPTRVERAQASAADPRPEAPRLVTLQDLPSFDGSF